MDPWIDIRPGSWPKGILRHMASTILRHSRQLPGWILSGFCSPLMLTYHGHYSNWMLRTLSYIGIFRRKFLWSNPQAMLLREIKSLSSQEGHIWTQVESKGVIWEVQPYHFYYWISSLLFISLCLRSIYIVWHHSSGCLCWWFLLTGNDSAGLLKTKQYLKRHFVTKDMGHSKYFLGIEVAHKKHNILLF